MFELERLLGPSERRIVLQTRRGRDIENSAATELTQQHQTRYSHLLRTFGKNWQERRPPTPDYNCAGHVWASRRTCVYEEASWRAILDDDGYRMTRNPMPDDLVMYVDPECGILHIGRIVELRPGLHPTSPAIPWVVSKWQDWTGEVMHFERDVPFASQGFAFEVEYWTDRPRQEREKS